MAKVTISQANPMTGFPDAVAIPIPARLRNKRKEYRQLPVTELLFNSFKMSAERYKELSSQKTEFDNGEISIIRDANFGEININDPNIKAEEIISRIENHSTLVVLLPIKTREDKEINSYVYLSSLRSLAQLITSDKEVLTQFKVFNLPIFPTLMDSISKIEEIFKDIDIEIFICLGTKPDDILQLT
jgi:hypothetical protein